MSPLKNGFLGDEKMTMVSQMSQPEHVEKIFRSTI